MALFNICHWHSVFVQADSCLLGRCTNICGGKFPLTVDCSCQSKYTIIQFWVSIRGSCYGYSYFWVHYPVQIYYNAMPRIHIDIEHIWKRLARDFVVFCLVMITFTLGLLDSFTCILQVCFISNGAIIWLLHCQWSNHERYIWVSRPLSNHYQWQQSANRVHSSSLTESRRHFHIPDYSKSIPPVLHRNTL